jgi:hypothetical protein
MAMNSPRFCIYDQWTGFLLVENYPMSHDHGESCFDVPRNLRIVAGELGL